MKLFQVVLALCLINTSLLAQEIDFNYSVDFENREDVVAAQDNFVKAANWLIETPYNPQNEEWKAVANYAMAWVSLTDQFSIKVTRGMLSYLGGNRELLLVFISAWGTYAIANPDKTDNKAGCCLAAMNVLIDYVLRNRDALEPSRDLDQIISKREKGVLEEWILEIVEE